MHRSEFAAAFGTDTRLRGNSEKQVVDAADNATTSQGASVPGGTL
jgi:hypothetical protein